MLIIINILHYPFLIKKLRSILYEILSSFIVYGYIPGK
jgi:hypothetical protein